ncbi:hypothetical protein M569_05417 [Genlisea aurea]|uniref:Biogenesis of lysosome-related organelles complex 1 subunit 1 n=1 Tax=Genlisea aurea TaxID=192259 RepID=S8CQE3_9LAMI|nr:hypothetical protein M569_05417 [Genlisea aurea]
MDDSAGSVEASLIQMINERNLAAVELRGKTDKARKEAIGAAARVSDLMVHAVNGGVQEVFINEERIEMEIRALTATISRFSKQTDRWLAASHSVNDAVKEMGDFENWMKTMELDCKSIATAIRNLHR